MQFQPGDVVALKSSPTLKMTVREAQENDVVCDWFNIDKNSSAAYMNRGNFLPQQLTTVTD